MEDVPFYFYGRMTPYLRNAFIVHRLDTIDEKEYSYDDVITEAKKLQQLLEAACNDKYWGVALNFREHTPALCVCLLSILNSRYFFCPLAQYGSLSEFRLAEQARKLGARFLFSDSELPKNQVFSELFQCEILNEKLVFYEIFTTEEKVTVFPKQICYCIGTSGSTGTSKTVYVPYSCISPNVDSLSNLLTITSKDAIMLFTPSSFDPFVLEFFLALHNGAALIVTSKSIRMNPQKLLEIMFPKKPEFRGVTILQMTPSLFRLLMETSGACVKKIFEGTSLRALMLGGEEFPSAEEWKSWLPRGFSLSCSGIRIYNVYGVTEVSCWSTIYEWTSDKKRIQLGTPIDSATKLRIIDSERNEICAQGRGELQIGSTTRKCYLTRKEATYENENILYRDTGDIVERDEKALLFYVGRLTSTFKRFGNMICLDEITESIKKILWKLQPNVACAFDENKHELIAFIALSHKHLNKKQTCRQLINQKLKSHEKPDRITFVNCVPLTPHGKKCPRELLEHESNLEKITVLKFKTFLEDTLGIKCSEEYSLNLKNKRFRSNLHLSFAAAGGTSFHALSLASDINIHIQRPEDQKTFLNSLLEEDVLLKDIIKFLDNVEAKVTITSPLLPVIDCRWLRFLWKANLRKCIDSTPSLMTCKEASYVCVGSHACAVFTLDGSSGEELTAVTLPDRVEGQVIFISERLALVGCYNGRLYAFDFVSGKVHWDFNMGGMIKSRPIEFKGCIVVSSYAVDFNLTCICLQSRTIKWRKRIGTKAILATPLLLRISKIIVCSLDGTYACVSATTGTVLWKRNLKSPIFSNPSTVFGESQVVIAEVDGVINICSTSNGEKICGYAVDGNIFSGVSVQENIDDIFITFGCHDHFLYCLHYNYNRNMISVHWKYHMDSPIFSTPKIFKSSSENTFLCACSTKGLFVILNIRLGSLITSYDLKGEVFSSPCISENNKIYIGCRDNFLYCLSFNSDLIKL